MKEIEVVHKYPFPWDVVTLAVFRKYPHDLCPHVKEVDVVSRSVDPGTGNLRTTRLFAGSMVVPKIVRTFARVADRSYALEESTVDPEKKQMLVNTVSLSMSSWVFVRERISIHPDPEKDGHTLATQTWECTWKGPPGLQATLERLSADRFSSAVERGRLAMQDRCRQILDDQ